MRVMVYEPEPHGHHLTYARVVIEALLTLGCDVVFTTSELAPTTPEYNIQIRPLESRIRLDATVQRSIGSTDTGRLRGLRTTARSFWAAIERCAPEHVLVPTADGITQALGVFPRKPPAGLEIEGLLMRGKWAYPNRSLRDRLAAWLSLNSARRGPWTTLYCLDELAVQDSRSRGGRLAQILRLMPHVMDPVEHIPAATAREALAFPSGKFYVGCIGALSLRKGIDVLLEAMGRREVPHDVVLVLMGKCDESLALHLAGPAAARLREQGRLLQIDRYVEERTLALGYAALDCVCTLHRDTTLPSSVLLHAAAHGKPVLGSNSGWIEHMIRKFELGWTADPSDPASVAIALQQARDGFGRYRAAPAVQELAAFHTTFNAKATWMTRIRERLAGSGLPPRRDPDPATVHPCQLP
jgi:glycosyltransferase involved in cell wall biosynthesis